MEEDTIRPDGEELESNIYDSRFEVKWSKKDSARSSPVTETVPAPGNQDDVATLRKQLEEEKQRANDLRDRWQRAAADLVNLRKRTEQEKGDLEKFAAMLLVQELLPVLDNFERALNTIPKNLRMLTWIYGVALIERDLQATLERRGLAPVETMGKPFDARFHEAISERETTDAEPGTIVQDFQKGYTMHGHVIRPALVEVARTPVASKTDKPGDESELARADQKTDEDIGP
jgi:molecular chaperone GrpE